MPAGTIEAELQLYCSFSRFSGYRTLSSYCCRCGHSPHFFVELQRVFAVHKPVFIIHGITDNHKKFVTIVSKYGEYILYTHKTISIFRDFYEENNYNGVLNSIDFLIDTQLQTLYKHPSFDT